MFDGEEVSVSGVDALSVTRSSKEYVSPAVRMLPGSAQVSAAPPAAPVSLLVAHKVVVA